MATLKYASFELKPCVYTGTQGWVLFDETRGWQSVHKAEINMVAAVKTKAEFDALFPHRL